MSAKTDPTRTGMTDAEAEAQARQIIADFATSYRDQTPLPRYGDAPPVPQPGIPPMSQRTTETARAVMFCSLATVPPGLIAVAVMVASEHANPTVIGMICAAPAAIAVPILALARLLRRAGQAAPAEIHQHYTGHVDQRTVQTKTTGLWAKTNNQQ
ncbi:hypothetical protein [Streptomyces azureus]|uniref:Uncharacterized protein n=1 Tax=Streptomyces azureus TaxID=146537 RepID=A0A0K8PHM8_STRAJ|nr:hypothetical protein [Streptomyces azureus]GAP46894.1 predicted protein [Streptomyces azureus]